MALPTLITVKGTYLKIDGTPETGTVQFIASVLSLKSGTRSAMVPSEVKVKLDETGSFEVILPASNDPAWIPVGWTYRVILKLSGNFSSFDTVIPYNAVNDEVFITALLPAQPGGSTIYAAFNHSHGSQYAGSVHTHEASDIVSGTIALARLPVGVGSNNVAAGDHTHNYDSVYAGVAHTHAGLYAALNHNHDSVYSALGHNHNYADLIGVPTDLATDADLATKLDAVNPVISNSTFTVKKEDNSSGIRMRSTGGAVDFDKMNGDIVVSSFAGPGFAGDQTGLQRWRNNGTTLAGLTEFGDSVYGGQQAIDATSGVAKLGAKNGLANVNFAGYKDSPGAPTTGTWALRDAVLDSAGAWHVCTTAGTPGTWT